MKNYSYLTILFLIFLLACEGDIYVNNSEIKIKGTVYVNDTFLETQIQPAKQAEVYLLRGEEKLYVVKTNDNGEFSIDFLPKGIKQEEIYFSASLKNEKGLVFNRRALLYDTLKKHNDTIHLTHQYKNALKVKLLKNNNSLNGINTYLFINEGYANDFYNTPKVKPNGFIDIGKSNLSGVVVFSSLPFLNSAKQKFIVVAKDTVHNISYRSKGKVIEVEINKNKEDTLSEW